MFTGCSDKPVRVDAASVPTSGPTTTWDTSGPLSFDVQPSGVARTSNPMELAVTVRGLPPDRGSPPCTAELAVTAYETEVQVSLQTVVRAVLPGPPFAGCQLSDRTVNVSLKQPLGDRPVAFPPSQRFVVVRSGGAYVRCTLPSCDPSVEPRIPARCGNGTLQTAVFSSDAPKRSRMSNERCEGEWAVIDVDLGAAACPATGDPANPCAGQRVDREFFRIVDGAWRLRDVSRKPGCDDVTQVEPDFPLRLCADLPAP